MKRIVVTRIAFVAALAALVVPAAQAGGGKVIYPEHGRGVVRAPGAQPTQVGVYPDDRRGVVRAPGVEPISVGVYPDDRRGVVRGPGGGLASAPVIVRVPDGGFEWGDAGIGAAGGFGLALLVGGAAFLLATHRSVPRRGGRQGLASS